MTSDLRDILAFIDGYGCCAIRSCDEHGLHGHIKADVIWLHYKHGAWRWTPLRDAGWWVGRWLANIPPDFDRSRRCQTPTFIGLVSVALEVPWRLIAEDLNSPSLCGLSGSQDVPWRFDRVFALSHARGYSASSKRWPPVEVALDWFRERLYVGGDGPGVSPADAAQALVAYFHLRGYRTQVPWVQNNLLPWLLPHRGGQKNYAISLRPQDGSGTCVGRMDS